MIPALAGIPIGLLASGVKTLGGVLQATTSGQKKAERALGREVEAIPDYTMSPSILKFYQAARQKYAVPPTQTAFYKQQMQDIERAGSTALSQLRSPRERLGGTSTIMDRLLKAKLEANVAAEQERNRRFSQFGTATQMMAGQEAAAEQRKLAKQQQKINLAEAKAVGRAAVKRAGLGNIFGGLTDIAKTGMSEAERKSYGG